MVAKSAQLLHRHFERPYRGNLEGKRHLLFALRGSMCHDEHVSHKGLLEILASFASSGPPLHLMVGITDTDILHQVRGRPPRVDAHLPTVDGVSGRVVSEGPARCTLYEPIMS